MSLVPERRDIPADCGTIKETMASLGMPFIAELYEAEVYRNIAGVRELIATYAVFCIPHPRVPDSLFLFGSRKFAEHAGFRERIAAIQTAVAETRKRTIANILARTG